MSTQFTNRQWRLPNNENKDKQSNYSMDFDGSSSVINLGNTDAVKLGAGDFTFSAWINPNSWGSGYEGIYSNNSTNGVFIGKDNAGNFVLRITSVSNVISYSTLPTVNTWTHICITRLNGTCTLYYNGSSVATGSSTQNFNANTNVYIGGDPGTGPSTSALINGQIDAVSIFNYALTDGTGGTVNQIAALYGSSSTGIGNPQSITPNPVAFYQIGDKSAFNGANYLVPNSSLKDYVFDFVSSNSNYIDCGYSALTAISGGSSTLTTPMTISMWFKLGSSSSKGLIGFGDLNNNYGGFAIRHESGVFSFLIANQHMVSGGYSFSDTTSWHNMVFVYDPSNASNCKVYIDSVNVNLSFINVGNISFRNSNLTNRKLTIGAYYGLSDTFTGKLSNVQTFNTALSATGSNSVETLYNNGSPLTSMTGFTSLQGWWKLDASATYDSSTGNWTIPDDSTNSNDGTSTGMNQANLVQSDLSFTSGYSPYALDFDGANDYINFTGLPDFGGGSLSISFWIKSGIDSSNAYVLMRSGFSFYIFQSGTASNLKYRIQTSSLNSINGGSILDNNWHNCVMTFDSTANEFKVFEDGNQVGSTVTTSGSLASSTSLVYLASFATGAPFKSGRFSNLSMWNTALTSSQVTELYNEAVPSNLNNHSAYSNLVSWWQLGSNSSFNSTLNQWTCIDEKGTNTGESSQTFAEDAIVDGVGSYANGVGTSGLEVIGSAPFSDANSLSVNMDVEDRTTDTPS